MTVWISKSRQAEGGLSKWTILVCVHFDMDAHEICLLISQCKDVANEGGYASAREKGGMLWPSADVLRVLLEYRKGPQGLNVEGKT
eukprot:1194697-Prorocentrum_minimum.AAC.5